MAVERISKLVDPRAIKSGNVLAELAAIKEAASRLLALPQVSIEICPVCQSGDRDEKFTNNGFEWVQCRRCTHQYKTAMPEYDALLALLASETVETYLDETDVEYRIDAIARPKYEYFRECVDGPGRWLDLGAGVGDLAYVAASDGWEVEATELHEPFLDFARQRFSLKLRQQRLEDYFASTYVGEPFDCVTALGYLDLVPDPAQQVALINQMLRPGGILGVDYPNHASLTGALVD